MKQFVIDQMKEYQHRQTMIKAIKYQEGMEDAWLVEYETYGTCCKNIRVVNKLFTSEDEARKYMASPTDETIKDNFCQYTKCFPVILRETFKEDFDDANGCYVVTDGVSYYDYDILTSDIWLTLGENSSELYAHYDSEDFFERYEVPLNKTAAHIGYDKESESLYVEHSCIRVFIDETEVATVEKLLEGFEIPFTEKIGQVFYK